MDREKAPGTFLEWFKVLIKVTEPMRLSCISALHPPSPLKKKSDNGKWMAGLLGGKKDQTQFSRDLAGSQTGPQTRSTRKTEERGRPLQTAVLVGGGGLVTPWCLTLVTPWTAARQAPLSMGFPRQEYWSGFPFLSLPDYEMPGLISKETNRDTYLVWQDK